MQITFKKKLLGILIITLMIFGDISHTIGAENANPYAHDNILPIEALERPNKARDVLHGRSHAEEMKSQRSQELVNYISEDTSILRDHEKYDANQRVFDSGSGLHEYDPELSSKLQIEKINSEILEQDQGLEIRNVTREVNEVFVPGMLDHLTHTVNSSGYGITLLDSTRTNYTLDPYSILHNIITNDNSIDHNGHFGLVVFVSDYKSRSIEKLQENKVWVQTYDRLQAWLQRTSDYYTFLLNEYASPGNIMGLLAAAQERPEVKSIGVTFVSHGVNSAYGHGVLIHHDDKPKELGVMNGKIFRNALEETGVTRISKLVHTNIHSCFVIDEYNEHGQDSVLGFFESQNYQQVLTGYRGLTYLNTKFVMSLENLLSAGTYILPKSTIRTPVVVTSNNNTNVLGRGTHTQVEEFTLQKIADDTFVESRYEDHAGDDTLFVNDINVSPAEGGSSSIYTDLKVYEHLNAPVSNFPTAGFAYNIEGHLAGTWSELQTVNDDHAFYFSRGESKGYTEEFDDISDHWNNPNSGVSTSNGYAVFNGNGDEINEIQNEVVSRPNQIVADINFILDTTIAGQVQFYFKGTSHPSLTSPSMNTERSFGFVYSTGDTSVYRYVRGATTYVENAPLVQQRQYNVRIEIIADIAQVTLTTPDDADFSVSFYSTGFADLKEPRLFMKSTGPAFKVDRVVISPSFSKPTFIPSSPGLLDDQTIASIKIYGSGGTTDQTSEFTTGMRGYSAGSTSSADWLHVDGVQVGETNRYLSFYAKLSNLVTDAKIGMKVSTGGTSQIYYIEATDNAQTLNDFVFATDGVWRSYVVDLYNTFGISGVITEISLQHVGGTAYFDSLHVSSDLTSSLSLSTNALQTEVPIEDYQVSADATYDPLVEYQFENTIEDQNGNALQYLVSGGGSSWSDDFNDGTIAQEWTVAGDTSEVPITESGGVLHFQKGTSNNGWSYSRVERTMSISATAGSSVDVDFTFNFQSTGQLGIRLTGVDGQVLYFRLRDFNAGTGTKYQPRLFGYDSSGKILDNIFSYGSTTGGSGHFSASWTSDTTMDYTITHPSGSISGTFTSDRIVNTIRLEGGIDDRYHSTPTYVDFDNYSEGVPTGGPTYGVGIEGQAIELDGSSYLSEGGFAPVIFDGTSAFSVMTWINPATTATGGIWSTHTSSSIQSVLELDSNNVVYSYDGISLSSASSIPANTWTHVTVVYDTNQVELYIDGQLEDIADLISSTSSTGLRIGTDDVQTGANYFDGLIDAFSMFDEALSPGDIEKLMDNQFLLRSYSFSDGGVDDAGGYDVDPFDQTTESGIRGNAAVFDGTADFEMPTLSVYRDHTLSLWIKAEAISDGTIPLAAGPTTYWDQVIDWSGSNIAIQDNNNIGYSISFADMNQYLNEWVHISLVFGPSSITAYMNGEQMGSTSALSNYLSLQRIGMGYSGDLYQGMMDEIRVHHGALSANEVFSLTGLSPQYIALSSDAGVTTGNNPVLSASTQILKGTTTTSKSISYLAKINMINTYGIVLDNGVWKEYYYDTVIPELSGYTDNVSYTVEFASYQLLTSTGISNEIRISVIPEGGERIEALSYATSSGEFTLSVESDSGYTIDTSLSVGSSKDSSLYSGSAADGAASQGAFALKFDRETYLSSVNVNAIVSALGTNDLTQMVTWYENYIGCADVTISLDDNQACIQSGGGMLHDPGLYSSGGFESSLVIDLGLQIWASGLKWSDRWFDLILQEVYNSGSPSFPTEVSEIYSRVSNGNHYVYYNKALTSMNVDVTINNPTNQVYTLHRIDSNGNSFETYTQSDGSAFTISVNPQNNQFFYLQLAHNSDLSNFGLSFTPQETTYSFAYLDRNSGTGSTTTLRFEKTGSGSLPISESSVSYIQYRREDGSIVSPVFDKLEMANGKYWLDRMVTIGNLDQSSSNDVPGLIDAYTYAESESTGEKLASGSTYWETNANEAEETYSLVTTTGDVLPLSNGDNYMIGFTLEGRYRQLVRVELEALGNSDIELYMKSDEPLVPIVSSGSSSFERKTYEFYIGTSPVSLLIKALARTYSTSWQECVRYETYFGITECVEWETKTHTVTPSLEVDLQQFQGSVGYFDTVDDVEEYKRSSTITSSGHVTTMVMGEGYQSNLGNEKANATVPPAARVSMTNASRTNPTENKVFDVTLLLEQIVADFTSFKNDVRDKVYDLLKISSPWGTSYQFADWVWSVLDEYGFGAVERIINFFQTEDMQNRLANVILNDAGLQEDLNLDTPDNPDYNPEEGLDYWAVAKVGILTFADYIHDIYIADGGWKEDTWNWIFDPGYTLVDLVDAALGAIGDAVNAVKNAATSFVNGIKNYLGYFKNAVLEIMTSMYVSVLQIMIHLVSEIISQYLPQELQIVKTSNGMTINGHPISVGKENLRIFFLFDNLKITVGNPFVESNFQYETLSIAETITLALDVGLLIAIVSTLIASRAGNNFLVRGIKIGTATILSIVLASSIPYLFDSQNSDRSDYVDEFIEFTFFNTIISLSIAEALKRKTNGDNGQAPSGMSAKDYAKSARIFVGLSVVSEVLSLLLDINQLTGSTTAHVTSTAIGFVSFVGGYSWAIFSESDIDNHDLRAFNQVIGLVCGIFWVIFNIIQNMQGL